jgi:Tfp pilus assembly ATPase PilU
MQLLDDHLFELWQSGQVIEEEILVKANNKEELNKRVANAKRGMFDDEADIERKAALELREAGAKH